MGGFVVDLLVTATAAKGVDEFFALLASLSVKNLGLASKFLGMSVAYDDKTGYRLYQTQMIKEMLEKHGLTDANPVLTPLVDGDDDGTGGAQELLLAMSEAPAGPTVKNFQSLVGSWLWLARCTRPDVAYAVLRVTRRAHQSIVGDYKTAKRVARYLKETVELGLRMCDDGWHTAGANAARTVTLESYSDADYAGTKGDRKSVSGCAVLLSGMVVAWVCQKQAAVFLFTMESEFVAAAVAGRELLGFKTLLEELGLEDQAPMTMWMGNRAAIKQVEGEDSSGRAKHIDIKVNFIKAKRGVIKPEYIKTDDMIADLFTKEFAVSRLRPLRGMTGWSRDVRLEKECRKLAIFRRFALYRDQGGCMHVLYCAKRIHP